MAHGLQLLKRREVIEMKGMLKAVVWDLDFNQLRIVLLAIIAITQAGPPITIKELEEILDAARAR